MREVNVLLAPVEEHVTRTCECCGKPFIQQGYMIEICRDDYGRETYYACSECFGKIVRIQEGRVFV